MNIDTLLKEQFIKNFNMEMIAIDLMEMIDDNKLINYIMQEFNENFMYGEIYDVFKDYLDKEQLKMLLEKMGHDFVDLEELGDDERDNYY